MKKFMEEFKKFALKGNVMDMAVGVIIGGAFTTIVTSLTDNFINPLIALCTGGANGEGIVIGGTLTIGGVAFNYGAFLSAVVNFLIMAMILFCLLKGINKLMSLGHKKVEEPVKTTKICPYCRSEIPKEACKCAHCTSDVEVEG